jgi:hypothetical protein
LQTRFVRPSRSLAWTRHRYPSLKMRLRTISSGCLLLVRTHAILSERSFRVSVSSGKVLRPLPWHEQGPFVRDILLAGLPYNPGERHFLPAGNVFESLVGFRREADGCPHRGPLGRFASFLSLRASCHLAKPLGWQCSTAPQFTVAVNRAENTLFTLTFSLRLPLYFDINLQSVTNSRARVFPLVWHLSRASCWLPTYCRSAVTPEFWSLLLI